MTAGHASPAAAADVAGAAHRPVDDLGWLLLRAARGYLTAATEATADVPGGLRGHHLMRTVSGGCPSTQLELAAGLGLDRTVLTYLVDGLADAGLVERQADPADRRARRVVLTTDGQRRLTEVESRLDALERALLPDLSPDQRAVVVGTLRTLTAATGTDAGKAATDAC